MPINQETDAPLYEAEAIEMAVLEWGERMDVDLPGPPAFLWFEGECLRYPGEGKNGCVGGSTWHNTFYDTEVHGLRKHADLVIAHELVHWALLENGDDPDSDHRQPIWRQVKDVRKMARYVLDGGGQ